MELYLSAGQPPDAAALHIPRGAVSLPLALAAARGHCEVRHSLAIRRGRAYLRLFVTFTYMRAPEHGKVIGHLPTGEIPGCPSLCIFASLPSVYVHHSLLERGHEWETIGCRFCVHLGDTPRYILFHRFTRRPGPKSYQSQPNALGQLDLPERGKRRLTQPLKT